MPPSRKSRGRSSGTDPADYSRNVFINCPFDDQYQELFDATVFTVFDCGYVPRCAKEIDDSGQVRIDKIFRIIEECRFGIHDLSRTELDAASNLPRFNMPLEFGIFLGAKRFGSGQHKTKNCLVLDVEPYRYQKFISDIAGQDIRAHGGDVAKLISTLRNWLGSASGRRTLPGGADIKRRFIEFRANLPSLCRQLRLEMHELTFNDYANIVSVWLQQRTSAAP